jgi:hypothetical protein
MSELTTLTEEERHGQIIQKNVGQIIQKVIGQHSSTGIRYFYWIKGVIPEKEDGQRVGQSGSHNACYRYRMKENGRRPPKAFPESAEGWYGTTAVIVPTLSTQSIVTPVMNALGKSSDS